MAGGSIQVHAISRITLALFEDSGWYQVDYSKADDMTFGKGLGCDFVKKSCLSWMKSKKGPLPFCTRESDLTYTVCEEGRLKIKTAYTEYDTCESPEQPVHIEKDVSGVGIVSMNIVCPPCQELCSDCAPAKQIDRKDSDSSKSSENANVGETKNPEDEKDGNQDGKGGDGSKDPEGVGNSGNSEASENENVDK
ncbi:unnamed protein product, partial [Haemonchus placei]|uniref:Leishmanolysin-like peptidase n=1 Tax=Haemonchus placei TaxID=6290 RepID=A0A0N4XC00_HAEPC